MQQHPVPQPISSYEFHLVGDMTLRQFGKLAAGIILALIVYALDPPGFIKWTLIFLFVSLGAGSAFVPFEGRPIDTWIMAFFKRIYSPTQYVWKQGGAVRIIPSIDEKTKQQTTFQSSIMPAAKFKPSPLHMPRLNIKNAVSLFKAGKDEVKTEEKITKKEPPKEPSSQTIILSRTPAPSNASGSQIKTFAQKTPATNLESPGTTILKPPSLPKFSPPTQTIQPKVEAKFVPQAMIPTTPTMSNLLVGFVHTPDGKIIENAILEVRDPAGNPVRAFKTNKLGQFRSATPLPNGSYEIETEKEGLRFDIIKVDLKGEILSPIEIVSK
ncbi:PrgI family protein [Patescibacteria group bacterium]|nr:PrgI family protein [Patescibacteria group bacterium]